MTNTGSAQNCQAKGNQAKPNATWENIKVATPEQPMKSVFHLGWQRSSCLLRAFPKPEETLSFHPQSLRHISVISPEFVSPYRKCYHGFFLIISWAASLKDMHLDSRRCWQTVLSFPPNRAELVCLSRGACASASTWMVYVFTPPNHPKEVRSLFHKGSVGTSRGKGHGSVDTSLWSVLTA